MQLLLLGTPRLLHADGTALHLERRKAFALLAYLAVTAQPHTRESLAALLWGDHDHTRAAAYLRNTLWTINKSLGEGWVQLEGDTIAFTRDPRMFVDVTAFTAYITQAHATADREERLRLLTCATEVYRGDFMTGFTLPDSPEFDAWQTVITERCKRDLGNALAALVAGHTDPDTAILWARRWVMLDSLHEPAHRALMTLYAQTHQQTALTRQYRDLVRLLAQELRTTPERETTQLYERLQQRATLTDPKRESQTMPLISVPTPVTPFVGRKTELTEIARLLDDSACRLLTLVAPGGMGKTRLAIQIAQDSRFPDGAYFVPLAPLYSADHLAPTIAANLPFVGEITKDHIEKRLLEQLQSKRLLLILDNFEHLLDGAGLIARILSAAPGVKILATSRERLHLQGEWLYEMHGLAIPDDHAESIETYDAIRLFVSSAIRVRPDFRITSSNMPEVIAICRAVAGMPLGIELAASWLQMLSPREIATEIGKNLDFLETGARDVPERHRSLRAVFESSWNRLTPESQTVLNQLSVFRGGFRLEAAGAVAGASLYQLLDLVNKSLLRRTDRFEMHELLRQYADHRLMGAERAQTLGRHAAYYAQFLAQQLPHLKGPLMIEALHAIEKEIDNIRTAWHYALQTNRFDWIAQIAEPLALFYAVRSRYTDIVALWDHVLERLEPDDPAHRSLYVSAWSFRILTRAPLTHITVIDREIEQCLSLLRTLDQPPALALLLLGAVSKRPGRAHPANQFAQDLVREAHQLFVLINDPWGIAYSLLQLGMILHLEVRYSEAREILNQSHTRFTQLDNPWGLVLVKGMLAENAFTLGHYHQSHEYHREMLPYLEQLGLIEFYDHLLYTLNDESFSVGRYPPAQALEENLIAHQRIGDRRGAAWTLYSIAWIYYFQGDYDESTARFEQTLRDFQDLGDDEGMIWSQIFLAANALERGDLSQIDSYLNGARAIMANIDFPWGEAGLRYVLGDLALRHDDLEQAERYYVEAVEIAYHVESTMQVLRHLSGIAEVRFRRGDYDGALRLAAFIRQHTISWDDALRRIESLIPRLQAVMSPDDFERGQTINGTLDTFVQSIRA
ncbi:MAG: NB-ARC domain-containing protein [Anaerolineae bacterium]|nr:NB-ARC domain-containing protein [Anaerolineae bacterium]